MAERQAVVLVVVGSSPILPLPTSHLVVARFFLCAECTYTRFDTLVLDMLK